MKLTQQESLGNYKYVCKIPYPKENNHVVVFYTFLAANVNSSPARKPALCLIVPEVGPANIYLCYHWSGTNPPLNVV